MPRIEQADWLRAAPTQAVFAALGGDARARAVGGAVRNALLGLPVTDVDFATTLKPDEVKASAARAGLKAIPTGVEHGTVTLVAGGETFEVTTLRKDVETFGRRARVAYTDDWEQDARRRDFTINALYAGADGTLFDPLGGMADIAARRVRFIGDPVARIREDFLRILRFFRFNAQYAEPPYDAAALEACVRERAGLAGLSGERVRMELMKLLAADGAVAAVSAMLDHGLLVETLGGVPYPARLEGLVALQRGLGLEADPTLRLAALAVTVAEDVERLRDRLRLSNAERDRLAGAAGRRPASAMEEPAARAALYRSGPGGYRDLALLGWAVSGRGADDPAWRACLSLPERWTAPDFPLRGQDLLDLGLPRGRRVGEVRRRLEADWIAGGFAAGRRELLAAARTLIEREEARR